MVVLLECKTPLVASSTKRHEIVPCNDNRVCSIRLEWLSGKVELLVFALRNDSYHLSSFVIFECLCVAVNRVSKLWIYEITREPFSLYK